jgi:formiminotetrahydrofolate cyclodeaminase
LAAVTDLADRSLNELLTAVAAATPAPGGGSSVGWTCAIAAGLAEMAAGITLARHDASNEASATLAEASERAAALRVQAIALAERELHAYEPVLLALRLPKSAPERAERLDAALSAAAETPVALAHCAAEIAAIAAELAVAATRHVQGDALAGLLLAEGACQAAARLARINLAGHPHDERLSELDELTTRAASLRARALSSAHS